MARLPLSDDARAMLSAEGHIDPPEDRTLSIWFWRRGRGPLTILAGSVLGLFFLPWIDLTRPELVSLSGFDLARSSAPHLFGGAIGAFLLIPLTLSRRSVYTLRGARPIATLFSLLTAAECALLFFKPPVAHALLSYELSFAPAFFASALLSLAAAAISLRLGGSASDFRDLGFDEPLRKVGEAVH